MGLNIGDKIGILKFPDFEGTVEKISAGKVNVSWTKNGKPETSYSYPIEEIRIFYVGDEPEDGYFYKKHTKVKLTKGDCM